MGCVTRVVGVRSAEVRGSAEAQRAIKEEIMQLTETSQAFSLAASASMAAWAALS